MKNLVLYFKNLGNKIEIFNNFKIQNNFQIFMIFEKCCKIVLIRWFYGEFLP